MGPGRPGFRGGCRCELRARSSARPCSKTSWRAPERSFGVPATRRPVGFWNERSRQVKTTGSPNWPDFGPEGPKSILLGGPKGPNLANFGYSRVEVLTIHF